MAPQTFLHFCLGEKFYVGGRRTDNHREPLSVKVKGLSPLAEKMQGIRRTRKRGWTQTRRDDLGTPDPATSSIGVGPAGAGESGAGVRRIRKGWAGAGLVKRERKPSLSLF